MDSEKGEVKEMFGIDERIKEVFREVGADIPGLRGIVLSTYDGLPVASDIKSVERQNKVAAMVSALVTLSKKVTSELEVGGMEAIAVEAEEGKIFCYSIEDAAILAVITNKDINLGILRLVVPKMIEKLRNIIL